jgi:hypothetical protein
VLVRAGGGHDVAIVRDVRAGDDIFVSMGSGRDLVTAQNISADELTLDGGTGVDYLNLLSVGTTRTFTRTRFEGSGLPV